MEKFVKSIKKKYREKLLVSEEQWPPVRGDKLINLQLVEADKNEGFRGGLRQHGASCEKFKRTPILYDDLFRVEEGKKPVRKVLVEGNGGIGKTTLCTMLSEGWGKEKVLTQFDCVLLLPHREKLVASAESLPDLIKLLHSSECVRTSVINELEESEGEKVLIIADGWDELEVAKRSKGSFLYKLLLGSVLPFASVLLTSRPSASAPLHSLPSVDRMVEVVGFNEEKIKQYIESEFEKNPEKGIGLIKQLEKNQILQSVCTIPLNCAITCNLWHTQYQELPSALTELYTQIILNVILRDIKKKFPDSPIGLSLSNFDSIPLQLEPYWWLTCKFAFEALSKDQLVFTEEEVTTSFPEGLDSSQLFLCFGLLQSANSLLPVGHGISFHFLHLTFQEYLAALHLVTLPPEEQLKIIRTHARSNRFAMVWRFFFGVGSKRRGSFPRQVSKKALSVDSVVVEEFLSILGNSRERQRILGDSKLRQFFRHFPKRYLNSGNHLLLCQCAFESNDDNLSDKIASDIDCVFLQMHSTNKIFDCAAVFHILSYTARCSRTCVDLNGWDLGDKELTGLTEILSHSHEKQLQMSSLDLSHNRLTNNGVSDLFNRASAAFCSLEVMNLEHNNIDGDCVSNIVSTLERISCKSLTTLVLSNSHLGVRGVQALERAMLAGIFINLEDLQLANTLTNDADINSALLTTLMRAIASHCHQVDNLRLSDNVLGVAGVSALGEAFLLVTNGRKYFLLDLSNTNLCASAITAYTNSILSSSERYNVNFQYFLSHWDCKYDVGESIQSHDLGFNYNALGYDGFIAFFRLLRSNPLVSNMYIARAGLPLVTNAECLKDNNRNTITGEMLCMQSFPQNDNVELLLIDNNNFSGKNLHLLVGLLRVCQSLRHLYSEDCHLKSEDLVQILTQLKSTRSSGITPRMKLQSWSLSNNNVDDVGIASLIECLSDLFPSLGGINLDGNPVSVEMTKRLKECLKINHEVACKTDRSIGRDEKLANKVSKVKEYSRTKALRDFILTEWRRTYRMPQSAKLLEEFLRMWNELLWEMCYCVYVFERTLESEFKELSPPPPTDSGDEAESCPETVSGSHTPPLPPSSPPMSTDKPTSTDEPGTLNQQAPQTPGECQDFKNVDNTRLDEDDFSDIQRELQGLESIYYSLGRNLHLTSDKLDVIRKDNPNDCVTAFSQVIDEWLRMNYNVPRFGRPSWQLLVKCVDAIDQDRAEAIANKHIVKY